MTDTLRSRLHRLQDRMSVAQQMGLVMALVSLAGISAWRCSRRACRARK